MFYHQTQIAYCKPIHNSITVAMADSTKTSCDQPLSAPIDLLISIAVIWALGYLLYPFAAFTFMKLREIAKPFTDFMSLLVVEVTDNQLIYVSIAFSTVCLTMALWGFLAYMGGRKCANADCKGLRNAAKFDIQIETEVCATTPSNAVTKKGVFELELAQIRILETELKKMAPLNGRAVLVYRLKCGCTSGRIEVPGPRKTQKTKK